MVSEKKIQRHTLYRLDTVVLKLSWKHTKNPVYKKKKKVYKKKQKKNPKKHRTLYIGLSAVSTVLSWKRVDMLITGNRLGTGP